MPVGWAARHETCSHYFACKIELQTGFRRIDGEPSGFVCPHGPSFGIRLAPRKSIPNAIQQTSMFVELFLIIFVCLGAVSQESLAGMTLGQTSLEDSCPLQHWCWTLMLYR